MNNLKLKSRSVAITVTLLSLALTGCMGTEEGTEVPQQPDNTGDLSEWGVYYTAGISDLPDCTDEHSGKLYFIGNDSGFVACMEGVWEEISLSGEQGLQGPAGADGADGADGANGSMPVVMEMTVTVSSFKYFIDGLQQGTITLYKGFTYNFDLSSVPSSHPFKIGTSANGNQYTSGVNTSGNIMSFTVPLDAPSTLYYYCQNHSNMGGTITINSLGSVS